MKASYKLQLEQHQRRLALTHKQLNKYDRKHNDINLINYLKSLNPVSGPTGFYGTFLITNEKETGSVPRHMHVTLGYNDIIIDGPHQINGDHERTFTIPIGDRAPLPSSTIQLKVTFQSSTSEVDLTDTDGFTITDFTDNPLTQENTLSMLIDSEYINNGACAITFVVTADL